MIEKISRINIYRNPLAKTVIIRMVGEHEKENINEEISQLVCQAENDDWCMLTVSVNDWNYDMTPWDITCDRKLLPLYLQDMAAGGAKITLDFIVNEVLSGFERDYPRKDRCYVLAGYSLAGLFALWSSYQMNRFWGVVAVSPSVWYPGWMEYISSHDCKAKFVYLSLGDKEHKTRNTIMSEVANAIGTQQKVLEKQGISVKFELNRGNHFTDVTERMVRGEICSI